MGVQERRAREKQELREEILEAARQLFITEGFENVSMRKIADRIEYSPTTIYLYFQDKTDLLDCVCEQTLSRLNDTLEEIRDRITDPLQRLRAGLRAYVDFGIEHPNDYRVSFMTDVRTVVQADEMSRCRVMGQTIFQRMRADVAQCIENGTFQPVDPDAASQALWAAAHGVASLLIVKTGFPWVDRELLIDTVIDTSLRGFRA